MKKVVSTLLVIIIMLSAGACGGNGRAPDPQDIHDAKETVGDWQTALRYLEAGNRRYLDENGSNRETNAEDRAALKDGQKPFAMIITCADSRVAPEIFFDQKLGDIFVARNAGNIADRSVLGSSEYAVEHLRVPLIVVVGHSGCGAVGGAFSGGDFPENLQEILNIIGQSIEHSETLEDAIRAHAGSVVRLIEENEVVRESGAKVMSAYYDIETGEVFFSED